MNEAAPKMYFGIKKEEFPFSILMCIYFFLVITSFWILKPIKKSLFIDYYKQQDGFDLFGWHMLGSQAELLAKVLNMFVAACAVAVFSVLSSRLRRQQLTIVFSLAFVVAYFLFLILLAHPGGITVWSFYLFGDLFSTIMVATFFAFLNDSVNSDSAKRTYGLVGFGGVLGGAIGATSVAALVKQISNSNWMIILAVIAFVIIGISVLAGRLVRKKDSDRPAPLKSEPKQENAGAFSGARLVFASKYLLAIVAIVGLYEMVSTIMDFQFTSTVEHFVKESTREHFSRVFTITNIVSMVVQLFLTSFVMTKFGIGIALLFLPIAALAGSTGYFLFPALLTGSILNTADNGFSYSINQSAKESLYVPTTKEEKYKAKAFIDMFVQRFAKALAVGLSLILTSIFTTFGAIRWLSAVSAVILVVWIIAARYAGKRFDDLATDEEKAA